MHKINSASVLPFLKGENMETIFTVPVVIDDDRSTSILFKNENTANAFIKEEFSKLLVVQNISEAYLCETIFEAEKIYYDFVKGRALAKLNYEERRVLGLM